MNTKTNNTNCRPSALSMAVASALTILATSASAETMQSVPFYRNADMSRWSDNYVEVGAASVTGTSSTRNNYKFGEFSGLNEEGTYGSVGFNYLGRSRQDDATHLHIYGSNLGLDTYKFMLSGGKQGSWTVTAGADRLTRSESDSGLFVNDGLGSSDLKRPAGYPVVTTTPGVPSSSLKPYDIKQTRDIYRLGLNGILSGTWDYKVSYREDQRTGTRLVGIVNSSSNAAIVPYEIDDKTQQIDAQLSYTAKATQAQLAYSYSKYSNSLTSFRIQHPLNTATNNQQRYGLMPSNEYHQIKATAAHNFTKVSRLTSTFSYGVAMQDERFLPFSVNSATPNLQASNSSLNGLIITSLADLSFITKPTEKSNLKLAYQYKGNDNKTPELTVNYIGRDGTAQGGATSANIRTNVPMSTEEQRYTIDGDYEIAPRTIVRTVLETTRTDYKKTDRAFTNTDKFSLELRRPFSDTFLGNLGYSVAKRTGSGYNKSVFFTNSYGTGLQNDANGRLTNHPSMRSLIYANYLENRVRAGSTWNATETISLQSSVDAYQQRQRGPNCGEISNRNAQLGISNTGTITSISDTCLGRNQLEGGSLNIDLQWQPDEAFSTFIFATLSQTGSRQTGRQWARNNGTGADESRNWYAKLEYQNETVGTGLKWQITPKWELGAQYAFNHGKGITTIRTGGSAGINAVAEMPDDDSRLHTFQLYGKWNYSSRMTVRLNYMYENLHMKDWAYDNIGATTNANILQTGQGSPRYSNHVIGASVALSTW